MENNIKTSEKASVDNKSLNFIYGNFLTRTLVTAFMKRWILKIFTRYYDSRMSKMHIRKFAKKRGIERTRKYKSFNDFFTRGEDFVEFQQDKNVLCSPVEASLTIFDEDEKFFEIKGEKHNVTSLLGGDNLGFENPVFCMFHLSTSHCHRAYAFDDGKIILDKEIRGEYNPTNPAVDLKGKNPLCTNFRVVHLFESENFGKVAVVQIGSMAISSVVRYIKTEEQVSRGSMYGAFKLGGSAIVLLLERDKVDLTDATLNEVINIQIGQSLNIKSKKQTDTELVS
ncbi:MAG: phosphatidylserine decarboxylase [bacterium]